MRHYLSNLFERWTSGDRRFVARLFGIISVPISWLYRAGLLFASLRRRRYPAIGSTRLIVVSSPLVGGVGKTPLSIAMVSALVLRQKRVGVVTMGYGRAVNSRASFHAKDYGKAADVGDEGMEIGLLTGAPVHVGPELADVIAELAQSDQFEWIVFDDGVSRSWDEERRIIVLSANELDQEVEYLPYGRWRAKPDMVTRAAFVAVTTLDPDCDREAHKRRLASWGYAGPIGWFVYIVNGISEAKLGQFGRDASPPPGPAFLFCGIGQPHRFIEAAKQGGIQVAGVMTFPDHHSYHVNDTAQLDNAIRQSGATWCLTTMKDAVRIPHNWQSEVQVYYLRTVLNQLAGDSIMDTLLTES